VSGSPKGCALAILLDSVNKPPACSSTQPTDNKLARMFKAANPYDEVVIKSTDENLTSESWELNLDVCDKVSGEGESG